MNADSETSPATSTLVKGHSLAIYDGADSFADTPNLLGGSGPRIVYGAIQ